MAGPGLRGACTQVSLHTRRCLSRHPGTGLLRRQLYATGHHHEQKHHHDNYTASNAHATRRSWPGSTLVFTCAVAIALISIPLQHQEAQAESVDDTSEVVIEKARTKKGASKEENRDLLSSQHLQVKRSWENPGVYAWGSNSGGVVAPDSSDAVVRTARRIAFFDDVLLRDLKLDRSFGAAIVENGDLVQWGHGYSEDDTQPTVTLKGKNLVSLAISADRIIGLSKSGEVFSLPVSQKDQLEGAKASISSWLPFVSSTAAISYRKLTPPNLSYGERVTAVSSGLEHALLLTSSGRVFSAASASTTFPIRGQLGISGLTWTTRPRGPVDMCHELTTLKGFKISAIATGDYHSLVLDDHGRVFSFGDNTSGQLGFDYSAEAPFVDVPNLISTTRLYTGTSQSPRVTSIAAGGLNSFLTIDATSVSSPSAPGDRAPIRDLGKVTADVWAFGQGIKGSLGTGRWTHIQGTPAKVAALSGLFEYDEASGRAVPIRMARISVGQAHSAATMANATYLAASEATSTHDTNWGADVLFWGSNDFYQVGTGKRSNVANPVYIRPLDMQSEIDAGRSEQHRFHVTPRHRVKLKDGRKVSVEQRVECGRGCTAVYSGV
ncbi:hypothetical protein DV736_g2837, partial [Chaetothyriales sp. CBS 134916]